MLLLIVFSFLSSIDSCIIQFSKVKLIDYLRVDGQTVMSSRNWKIEALRLTHQRRSLFNTEHHVIHWVKIKLGEVYIYIPAI